MSFLEMLETRRTYRRFLQKPVPQDVIDDIITALRLSNCARNRQCVRLVIVNKPEDVKTVNSLVKWAAALPPEQGTPKADEIPTLFVAVYTDEAAGGHADTDAGLAIGNMTMAAWEKGVGSCIMRAINYPKLTELFGMPENYKLHSVVAFGYPGHTSRVVPMVNNDINYYLDENRDYCVPKRSVEELAKYF